MTDQKWETFASTGKIEDYLKYRELESSSEKNGVKNGDYNREGHSPEGISFR